MPEFLQSEFVQGLVLGVLLALAAGALALYLGRLQNEPPGGTDERSGRRDLTGGGSPDQGSPLASRRWEERRR